MNPNFSPIENQGHELKIEIQHLAIKKKNFKNLNMQPLNNEETSLQKQLQIIKNYKKSFLKVIKR